ERTREIGIRRALGAKRRDITQQFLIETVVLAGVGGLLGVGLGFTIPQVIIYFIPDQKAIVTGASVMLAFSISVAIGILFGIYPARRAALMDPIEALRHESSLVLGHWSLVRDVAPWCTLPAGCRRVAAPSRTAPRAEPLR